MKITKPEKKRIVKGAVVGGVIGAFVGMPILGAATGGYVNYLDDPKKKNKFL